MVPSPPLHHVRADHRHGGAEVLVNLPQHEGEIPLHDHDFLEIALVLSGHGLHRTIHGLTPIAAGEVLILHPGQWHAYESCRGLHLANCCIGLGVLAHELEWTLHDPRLALLLPHHHPGTPLRRDGTGQEIRHFPLSSIVLADMRQEMVRIRELQTGASPSVHRPEVIARTLLLLSALAAAVPRSSWSADLVEVPSSIRTLREAIEERLDHPWGLEEMERRAGLSRFHLVRIFRRHLGEPPMAWLARRRLERAAVLLVTSDLPIAEIGARVGWTDANFFARRFRARFSQTPSAYRRSLPVPALPRAGEDWIQW